MPFNGTNFIPSGTFFASSSVIATGRTAACGQIYEQMPHWMHFSGSHAGTFTAMPRFSYADEPEGVEPSV